MTTGIYLSEELKNTLASNNIQPEDYKPAYNSAGLDLYYVGTEPVTFTPVGWSTHNRNVLLPTGLKLSMDRNMVGLITERGSIIKPPLKVRAGVVDVDFSGQVFVNCVNVSNTEFTIQPNQKLPFQLIVVPCDNQFSLLTEREFNTRHENSARKDKQVGSSD